MAKKRIATFLGPNQGLSVVGDHAYAYSGGIPASTTASTVLSFTTGKYYVEGWLQFNGYVMFANASTGNQGTLDVTFNGQTVIVLKTETELETSSPHSIRCPIIIPPFTAVTVLTDASADEAANLATVVIIGKVYA